MKKYEGCMNFLVYVVVGMGLEKPMLRLKAQFDKEDDALLFIDSKKKIIDKEYVLFNNVTHEDITI